MKIKLLASVATPLWGGAPGEVADVPEVLGRSWIRAGLAERAEDGPATQSAVIETAAITPPETAMLQPPIIKAAGRSRKR